MKLRTKLVLALTMVVILPALIFGLAINVLPETSLSAGTVIFLVVLALVLTVTVLFFWIYSGFIKPLSELKRATKQIKDGNLEYELQVKTRDEIGELCTDFEEMRKRLKEVADDKQQVDAENRVLIRNISHDLKTPITAIKGYAGGILDGVASSPEKLDKYVRTIYSKANDMDALIDELVLYSKIDTNRIPYSFKPIDVEEFFGGYASEIKDDLDSQGIELTYYNYLTSPVKIIGDGEQLRRVLNNIISNSVKYMDKTKGFMAIRIRDDNDGVLVEIEDNGKGIARKDLPYIFDRFYRTDSSRNSSTGGSGIGLSIVKKIIEDHGGRIWATGDEGVGTVMHFVLRKYQEATQ